MFLYLAPADRSRAHIDKDLESFICLSERCQKPLRFFPSQEDWLKHMDTFHGEDWTQKVHMMTWFCDLDHAENLEFFDEEAFREHYKVEHPDVSGFQVNAFVRRKRGMGQRDTHTCPFCERDIDELSNVPIRDPHSFLIDHIAHHLKSLALFSLPS